VRERIELLGAIGKEALGLPDRVAHGLIARDLNAWLRLQFLGVAARTGIAKALPCTAAQLAFKDTDLALSFLRLGVALGELKEIGGRFEIKGRRLKAVAGSSPDLAGLVEELVSYDSPIYANLEAHLDGGAKGSYDAGLGDVIARASRLAESALGPVVRSVVHDTKPTSIIDVGCGTGVYVKHALDAAPPGATVHGIDINADAIANAVVDAKHLRRADLFEVTDSYDLALLLQNIYYWRPEDRPKALTKLREITKHTAVVASAVANGQPVNFHLDLVLRVTEGTWRLPTKSELEDGLKTAGFERVRLIEPVPGAGLVVGVAHARPERQTG
jgi:4-hydroxy-2,2'-bipyrrole-5-carbaldehyde O-methyltransferase